MLTLKASDFPERLKVSGNLAGTAWQRELVLDGGQEHVGISGLWARRKIASLMDSRLNNENREAIEQQILNIALEHHLVSKFTSFVAVDVTPEAIRESLLKTKNISNQLPAGWEYDKVFGGSAQTATPALLNILIGLLLSILSLPIFQWLRMHKD